MSGVRVRRHADGRVAIKTNERDSWLTITALGSYSGWESDADVSGNGWTELLVTELPEPDDSEITGVRVRRIKFGTVTATINPDGSTSIDNDVCFWGIKEARATALNLLAAVAACEQHREQKRELDHGMS